MEDTIINQSAIGSLPLDTEMMSDNGASSPSPSVSPTCTASQTEPLDLKNFQKLPFEVRGKIWKLLIKTRLVQLELYSKCSGRFQGPQQYMPHIFRGTLRNESVDNLRLSTHVSTEYVGIRSATPLPVISKVCKESRDVFEREYYPWMTGEGDRKIWINGAVDRVNIHDLNTWVWIAHRKLKKFFGQGSQEINRQRRGACVVERPTEDPAGTSLVESPALKRSREIKSLVLNQPSPSWSLLLWHAASKYRNQINLQALRNRFTVVECKKMLRASHWLDWFPACTEIIIINRLPEEMPRNACLKPSTTSDPGDWLNWEYDFALLRHLLVQFSTSTELNKWDSMSSALRFGMPKGIREYDGICFALASVALGDKYGEGDENDSELVVQGPPNEEMDSREQMWIFSGWTEESGFPDADD